MCDEYQVFIISQGRDGSTLMLKLLNTIKGFNICGENFGFMNLITDIFTNLHNIDGMISREEYDKKIFKQGYKPSWYNNFTYKEINDYIVGFCKLLFNKDSKYRVWGCKEIRYAVSYDNTPSVVPYNIFERRLKAIQKIFPKAKFIFTYRENIAQQLKSGWWKANPSNSKHVLATTKEYFKKYAAVHNNSHILSYEDIVQCTNNFKETYNFLGEAFDKEIYKKVLSVRM